MIVPFTPGGVADNIGRVFGERMGRELGQQFIIDNRAGANGRIGADSIAKSPPDGYSLLLSSSEGIHHPSACSRCLRSGERFHPDPA